MSQIQGDCIGPLINPITKSIEVVIRGHNEYALAGELAGLVEWLEVTGPPGVRDHLASIGNALINRYR